MRKLKLKIARARHTMNQTLSFIVKVAVAVAAGILLADIAAPFLGL